MSYSEKMEALRDKWGGRCVHCGSRRNLQFAHLPGRETFHHNGRGMPNRYHDIKRNPRCYVLLCERSHRALDRGDRLS